MKHFDTYASHEEAAAAGCFCCKGSLKAEAAEDAGYPPGRGQWAIRCQTCGRRTFYDIPHTRRADHNE